MRWAWATPSSTWRMTERAVATGSEYGGAEDLIEGAAGDELHGHVVVFAVAEEAVEGSGAGVVQLGESGGLNTEALDEVRLRGDFVVEHLHGDAAIDHGVDGLEDSAHATGAQLAGDAVSHRCCSDSIVFPY
ncbi:MAG: hypothetical protein QM757_08575 [Paludibaculum sp.]